LRVAYIPLLLEIERLADEGYEDGGVMRILWDGEYEDGGWRLLFMRIRIIPQV
jgi:hypothetical protein